MNLEEAMEKYREARKKKLFALEQKYQPIMPAIYQYITEQIGHCAMEAKIMLSPYPSTVYPIEPLSWEGADHGGGRIFLSSNSAGVARLFISSPYKAEDVGEILRGAGFKTRDFTQRSGCGVVFGWVD